MKTTNLIAVAIISAGLAFAVTAQANEEQEEHLAMKDLPAAVQKTLEEKAGGSEITRVEKEMKDGKIVYEGVIKKNGKEWGLAVDENGKYLGKHSESDEKEEHEH